MTSTMASLTKITMAIWTMTGDRTRSLDGYKSAGDADDGRKGFKKDDSDQDFRRQAAYEQRHRPVQHQV
ncbi:unnamed protein product [Linum trigynum]|uniref:Uncharacterized protein n=1 Tax=Linum trigynum TaxID=586398 RepID=A0AAV2DM89_9ROSI